jgi:hypothetical protein
LVNFCIIFKGKQMKFVLALLGGALISNASIAAPISGFNLIPAPFSVQVKFTGIVTLSAIDGTSEGGPDAPNVVRLPNGGLRLTPILPGQPDIDFNPVPVNTVFDFVFGFSAGDAICVDNSVTYSFAATAQSGSLTDFCGQDITNQAQFLSNFLIGGQDSDGINATYFIDGPTVNLSTGAVSLGINLPVYGVPNAREGRLNLGLSGGVYNFQQGFGAYQAFGNARITGSFTSTVTTPEPWSLCLAGIGFFGIGIARRRMAKIIQN